MPSPIPVCPVDVLDGGMDNGTKHRGLVSHWEDLEFTVRCDSLQDIIRRSEIIWLVFRKRYPSWRVDRLYRSMYGVRKRALESREQGSGWLQ